MAADSAPLAVQLVANTTQFEKEMARAFKGLQAQVGSLEKTVGSTKIGVAFGRNINQGAQQAARGIQQTSQAAGQLSFQLNDIATSLQGGASPFTVMMQQGSQVAQIFQQLKTSGGGMKAAFGALASAFGSMFSPIGLAVNAAILGTGYLISYLTQADDSTEGVNKALQAQADLLGKVAKAWGDQLPEVAELAAELERISEMNDRAAATAVAVEKAYAPLVERLQSLSAELASVQLDLQTSPDAAGLNQAIADLNEKMANFTATSEDADKVIQLMLANGVAATDPLIVALHAIANSLDAVAGKADRARESLRKMNVWSDEYFGPLDPRNPLPPTVDVVPTPGKPNRPADPYFEEPEKVGGRVGKAAATEFERVMESTIGDYARKVAQVESGGKTGAKNPLSTATGLGQFIESTWLSLFREVFAEEAASMTDRQILALRTNGEISLRLIEEYGRRNAELLRNAGQAVNQASLYLAHFLGPQGAINVLKAPQGTPVSSVVPGAVASNPFLKGMTTGDLQAWAQRKMGTEGIKEETDAATLALKEQEDQAKRTAEQWAAYSGIAKSAISGIVQDMRNGVSAGDAFRNALVKVSDSLMQMALDALFSQNVLGQLFGMGTGGTGFGTSYFPPAPLGGGLYHKGGKVGSTPVPTRIVNPGIFAGAPRLHGGLMPGEFPAILQRGEIVLPKGAAKGGQVVGGNTYATGDINIDMSQTGKVASDTQAGRDLGILIQKQVQKIIVTESRPGGLLRAAPLRS